MVGEREARNRLGDLVVTDPRMMRALAHPARLAIMDILRREGPSSATELAPRVGISPSAASWHLRHLAGFGLVRDGEPHPDGRARRWESAVRGFRFDVPDGGDGDGDGEGEGDRDDALAEGRVAARMLVREMMLHGQALLAQWLTDIEPGLDGEWAAGAGVSNTRVVVDAEELAAILDGIEEVLAPYANRDPAERPAGSRSVRLLRYALPEARDIDQDADARPETAGGDA